MPFNSSFRLNLYETLEKLFWIENDFGSNKSIDHNNTFNAFLLFIIFIVIYLFFITFIKYRIVFEEEISRVKWFIILIV